ncbi:MAG: sugar transferase [Candidatus Sulfotelmatobacter sp.]|jgi:lipopolysaccharide/colanic/teichoic acid biosynthesis glycosyltransferase
MKQRTLSSWILICDLLWSTLAMGGAASLRYGTKIAHVEMGSGWSLLLFLVGTWVIWIVLSLLLPLDGFRGGWRVPAVLSQLFPAVSGLMAALFAAGYVARIYTSRLVLGYFGVLLFLGFVVIRFTLRSFLASRYRVGAVRRTVIVGDGPLAQEMAATIDRHPELLCQIVGFLCPAENAFDISSGTGADLLSVQTMGIVDLLQSRRVDEIILTVPEPGHPEILDLAAKCRRAGLAVSLVPQPYELYLSKPELMDLDGLPLLQWGGAGAGQASSHWKRALDLALTTCLLPLALAAIAPAALLLKLRKGKAFRPELRCGQHGKTFWMYRLNSDRHAVGLPVLEFLMQRSSLTELPQLFNVLNGEMSLVGPRPEGPERTRHYSEWQSQRLSVKPGITGLAQVHGLRDQNSSEDKTRYDLQYILHGSAFQDISLLLQTAWTIALRVFQWQPRQAGAQQVAIENRVDTVFEETLSSAHSSQSSSD